jgi:hypothetical protein
MESCVELHRDAKSCVELYKDAQSCVELYRDVTSCVELYRDAKSCEELQRDAQSCVELCRVVEMQRVVLIYTEVYIYRIFSNLCNDVVREREVYYDYICPSVI